MSLIQPKLRKCIRIVKREGQSEKRCPASVRSRAPQQHTSVSSPTGLGASGDQADRLFEKPSSTADVGQKRTSAELASMSALPLKADIARKNHRRQLYAINRHSFVSSLVDKTTDIGSSLRTDVAGPARVLEAPDGFGDHLFGQPQHDSGEVDRKGNGCEKYDVDWKGRAQRA
jgi:hypothetical protein